MNARRIKLPLAISILFAAVVVAFASSMGRDASAMSATPEAEAAFKELMAAKWLTCRFSFVKLGPDELLYGVGYHPKDRHTMLFTSRTFKESKEPPSPTEEREIFAKSPARFVPEVLVFDGAKTSARAMYRPVTKQEKLLDMAVSAVGVQRVDWLMAGVLQVGMKWTRSSGKSMLGTIAISSEKMVDGSFAALASMFEGPYVIVLSGRCVTTIDAELRSAAEDIYSKLNQAPLRSRRSSP